MLGSWPVRSPTCDEIEGVEVALEFGLWNVDGDPVRMAPVPMALESRLERLLEADPSLLGQDVLIVGRQVPTDYGKYVDLLALDEEGNLLVFELKRDRTPREVVAQLLDYGSWVVGLGYEDIKQIFATRSAISLDEAFDKRFGRPLPDELNTEHALTIVASSLDASTERIVDYLNRQFGVPINAAFFNYFEHDDHSYLARTWLVADGADATAPSSIRRSKATATWNGTDWYASFGTDGGKRSWEDARRYGFVSAGGGEWYSRTLKSLPPGARVMVCIPKQGYVGVGEVMGPATPFAEAIVDHEGQQRKLSELPLTGDYTHPPATDGSDSREYVVPVTWIRTVAEPQAFWKTGMFANQNSACKLRNQFTIDEVTREFGIDE